MEFIQHLIQHIPGKHYKMIRYGGIYARHREIGKNPTEPYSAKNTASTGALTNGVLLSFLHLAMTR